MTSPDSRKSVDSLPLSSPKSAASQQTPFQQADSNSKSVSRHRLGSRRSSNASSITSLGSTFHPPLLQQQHQQHGSIAEAGQNAISTLLQPPIVRTGLLPHTSAPPSGYKQPSSRDIPPVTLTNIPHVDSASFQPYLLQVGSLYDALHHAKENGDQDTSIIRRNTPSLASPELDRILSKALDGRQSGSLSSSEPPTQRSRPSSSHRSALSPTPLSTIPNVYFDENFQLENPRTFDIVSERSEVISSPKGPARPVSDDLAAERRPSRKALATNAILQEKLSWYLDTVEIHLLSSISTASKSFFSALGSLRDLHTEAATSVNNIKVLRADLAKLDADMAQGGLKVVKLQRRRENVRKLADAVCQLQEVISSVSKCEKLIDSGDLEDAIDELDDAERLLVGERPVRPRQYITDTDRIIDLRGVDALDRASDDFAQLRSYIGAGYESRFLNILLEDLRQHVENSSPEATLLRLGIAFQRSRRGQRNTVSSTPAYLTIDSEMRSKLQRELSGLGRARYTMTGATSFKNAVLREMKNIIRRNLPSSTDEDNESIMSASTHGGRQLNQQEKSSILARNLRSLGADDAFSMLTTIYTGISEALRRLSVQVKVLLDITSNLGNPSASVKSPTRSQSTQSLDTMANVPSPNTLARDEILQVLDMSSLLGQAVDIVQSQIVKVSKVRGGQIEFFTLEQFLQYFTLNRLFAEECEAISGRSGTALKTVVDTQIKNYISSFGDAWKHRIVQVMDLDKWDAKDFGDREHTFLSRVLDASTHDAEVWSASSRIWDTGENDLEQAAGSKEAPANGSGANKERVRSATLDEQKFILPESAFLILQATEEFQHFMAGIPNVVPDIAPILLECLKLFNSRTSQLILGAGATKSAGLKNITTKHLALASQSLSFITALIPYVREFIRRHCPSTPVMGEFDKVKRLYQEHQSGIHEKLVDIMSSRASVHVTSMKKMDWEAELNTDTTSPYMEVLAKETGTLHRVLSKHLPDSTVAMIMGPVFASYKDQWTDAFQQAPLKSEKARQRMLSDVQFLRSKLEKLDGGNELASHLTSIIEAKHLAASSSSPTPSSGPPAVPSRDASISPSTREGNDSHDS
ncbi:hypothetical protein TRV_00363 [Trichophyton verrucosum HKI 0517]|uniref:Vacuolar protein sorting-associated protein 54 C-terminal domain-containing protein n=1 Tax=Trichophyton verrucosum (strain HKI 0517) TaxID=663202 RepID=D4CZW9_TRIVH|nr:uncharacterized protein TRV_00363 [Trichophyton verrucosum HKI 0517]EFE44882.1 hypothetical protein TRV_00363 [Trichophyton verrucosum HKI 0517]